jgi:Unconventional myosin tail, actin- and lipid-binding
MRSADDELQIDAKYRKQLKIGSKEAVILSTHIAKINEKNKAQERTIVITNTRILSLDGSSKTKNG